MTVYGDLTYAVEIGMALIVVGLGLCAIFTMKISQDDQMQRYVLAKEFIWAYILALMWPGLDRFYLGDSRKGILFSVSALILLPTIVGSLVLWLVNLLSVYRRTDAYNLDAMKQDSQTIPSEGLL